MFWRVVRGMLPHKLKRGAAAMDRLKVFEGIPPPYDKVFKTLLIVWLHYSTTVYIKANDVFIYIV